MGSVGIAIGRRTISRAVTLRSPFLKQERKARFASYRLTFGGIQDRPDCCRLSCMGFVPATNWFSLLPLGTPTRRVRLSFTTVVPSIPYTSTILVSHGWRANDVWNPRWTLWVSVLATRPSLATLVHQHDAFAFLVPLWNTVGPLCNRDSHMIHSWCPAFVYFSPEVLGRILLSAPHGRDHDEVRHIRFLYRQTVDGIPSFLTLTSYVGHSSTRPVSAFISFIGSAFVPRLRYPTRDTLIVRSRRRLPLSARRHSCPTMRITRLWQRRCPSAHRERVFPSPEVSHSRYLHRATATTIPVQPRPPLPAALQCASCGRDDDDAPHSPLF